MGVILLRQVQAVHLNTLSELWGPPLSRCISNPEETAYYTLHKPWKRLNYEDKSTYENNFTDEFFQRITAFIE
jgi:hypothetical protein